LRFWIEAIDDADDLGRPQRARDGQWGASPIARGDAEDTDEDQGDDPAVAIRESACDRPPFFP
jgi:hypothetical protein